MSGRFVIPPAGTSSRTRTGSALVEHLLSRRAAGHLGLPSRRLMGILMALPNCQGTAVEDQSRSNGDRE